MIYSNDYEGEMQLKNKQREMEEERDEEIKEMFGNIGSSVCV